MPATTSNWTSRDFNGLNSGSADRRDTSYRRHLPQQHQRRGLPDDVGDEQSPEASFGHLSSIGTFTPGGLGATPSGWGPNSRTPGDVSGRNTSRYSTSRNPLQMTPRTEGREMSGSAAWASPLLTAPRMPTTAARTAADAADATGIWHSARFQSQGSLLGGGGDAPSVVDYGAEKEPIQARSRLRFNFDDEEAHQSGVGDEPHTAAAAAATSIPKDNEAAESPQLSLALFRALVVAAEGDDGYPQAAHVDNELVEYDRREEGNYGGSAYEEGDKEKIEPEQQRQQEDNGDDVYIDDPVLRYRRNITRDGGVYAKTVAHVAKQKQWRAMLQRKDPTCSFQPKLNHTRPKRLSSSSSSSSSSSARAPHRSQGGHPSRRRHSGGSFRVDESSGTGFSAGSEQQRRRHSATESGTAEAAAAVKARAAEANERAIARGRDLFEHAAVIAHNRCANTYPEAFLKLLFSWLVYVTIFADLLRINKFTSPIPFHSFFHARLMLLFFFSLLLVGLSLQASAASARVVQGVHFSPSNYFSGAQHGDHARALHEGRTWC